MQRGPVTTGALAAGVGACLAAESMQQQQQQTGPAALLVPRPPAEAGTESRVAITARVTANAASRGLIAVGPGIAGKRWCAMRSDRFLVDQEGRKEAMERRALLPHS